MKAAVLTVIKGGQSVQATAKDYNIDRKSTKTVCEEVYDCRKQGQC